MRTLAEDAEHWTTFHMAPTRGVSAVQPWVQLQLAIPSGGDPSDTIGA